MERIKIPKFILIVFTTMLFANSGLSQQVMRTYYDFHKTSVSEEWQVNKDNVKHGYYKQFDREGKVMQQATYKNGMLNGQHFIYMYENGPKQVSQLETFKDDVKDGPAEYYAPAKELTGVPVEKGTFKQGKKDGVWTFVKSLSSIMGYGELEDPMYKGCDYIKYTENYVNGERFITGVITSSYFPCSKPFMVKTFKENVPVGKHYYFKPDGNVYGCDVFDSLGKKVLAVSFKKPGCKLDTLDKQIVAVGLVRAAERAESERLVKLEQEKKAIELEAKYKVARDAGDIALKKREYSEAKRQYRYALEVKANDEYSIGKINEIDLTIEDYNTKLDKCKRYVQYFSRQDFPTQTAFSSFNYDRYPTFGQDLYTLSGKTTSNLLPFFQRCVSYGAGIESNSTSSRRKLQYAFIDSLYDVCSTVEKLNDDYFSEPVKAEELLKKLQVLKDTDKKNKKTYSQIASLWEKRRKSSGSDFVPLVTGSRAFNTIVEKLLVLNGSGEMRFYNGLAESKSLEQALTLIDH